MVAFAMGLSLSAAAQQTPVFPDRASGPAAAPDPTFLSATLARSEGIDRGSGISFVRVFLVGSLRNQQAASPLSAVPAEPVKTASLVGPTLTAQCTRNRAGKIFFEVFANFGGVSDTAFYPPWHATAEDLFAPRTGRTEVTLEFLGYRRVSPFKRQFETVAAPGPPQLRYVPPGGGSANLEPVGWFFQYLRALPTLRLSANGQSADFQTTPWLAQLRAEPLCSASGA